MVRDNPRRLERSLPSTAISSLSEEAPTAGCSCSNALDYRWTTVTRLNRQRGMSFLTLAVRGDRKKVAVKEEKKAHATEVIQRGKKVRLPLVIVLFFSLLLLTLVFFSVERNDDVSPVSVFDCCPRIYQRRCVCACLDV